jgi:hypothetical protein
MTDEQFKAILSELDFKPQCPWWDRGQERPEPHDAELSLRCRNVACHAVVVICKAHFSLDLVREELERRNNPKFRGMQCRRCGLVGNSLRSILEVAELEPGDE